MAPKSISIIAFIIGVAVVGLAAESRGDYRTYVVRPAVSNDAILEGEPLPVRCRDEKVMKVLCARGEYEPASFLIETEQRLKQVMVRVGPLTGEVGTLLPETVDVRVAQMTYVHVGVDGVVMPWILVRDPNMLEMVDQHPRWVMEMTQEEVGPPNAKRSLAEYREGYSKMMQLTRELVDTPDLQPADVTDRQQFWLTVHIPTDAKPGVYTAPVMITADNAAKTELLLEVTVPSFDLLPPPFEYGVYNPTHIEQPGMTSAYIDKYHPVTEEQYLAELRNMVAHGCTNPVIYQGPTRREDGSLDYSMIERILALREEAGMHKGTPLYMMTAAGEPTQRPLTADEYKRAVHEVRELVSWVRGRGYTDVYVMAGDELSGERLRSQRHSIEALHEGGGKVFAACYNDFFGLVGDVFDLAILCHPGSRIVDAHQQWQVPSREQLLNHSMLATYTPQLMMTPEIQEIIKGVHNNGFKIFTYLDPPAGYQLPDWHRRHRGLGLWKIGLDGTMTWTYVHTWTRTARTDDPYIQANGVPIHMGFVVRGPQGVLDTLNWEAYREGVDDARYLATLQDAMTKATAAGKHPELIAETTEWMSAVDVEADLDGWRAEMARRTELLLQP